MQSLMHSSSNTSFNNSNNNNIVNNNLKKQIKIGNYALGMTIGKGNSAVVKLATHLITKQKVAIKMFDKSGLDSEKQLRLRREIDSMKRLKHKNIIRLYEIMETNKLICLVTEYAGSGELYDYIIHKNRLSEREARPIFKQIVLAISYCHSNFIVHRDVKVENVLLDYSGQVKLADFGFSSYFNQGELLDVYCGSPPYCAPELYLAKQYDGPKVDIWSLGVVLYVLVCGQLPFEARAFNALRAQVISGSYKTPFFLSKDCINLIKGMLTVEPNERFSIDDIINHEWFRVKDSNQRLETILDANLDQENDTNNINGSSDLINEKILKEVKKYNLDLDEIIKSVQNNEFDSNAGIYHLIESKFASKVNSDLHNNNSSNDLHQKSKYKFENNSINSPLNGGIVSSIREKQMMFTNNSESIDLTNSNNHNCYLNENNNNTSNNNNFNNDSNENELKKVTKFWKGANINNRDFSIFNNNSQETNIFSNLSLQKNNNISIVNGETTPVASMSATLQLTSMNNNNNNNQVGSSALTPLITLNENDKIDEEDEDEEMPIEELGKDYLCRYNSIRRHTIGTNIDNNKLDKSFNNIMKSTECLQLYTNEISGSAAVSLSRNDFENLNINNSCTNNSYNNDHCSSNNLNLNFSILNTSPVISSNMFNNNLIMQNPDHNNNDSVFSSSKKICNDENKKHFHQSDNNNNSIYHQNKFQKMRHKPAIMNRASQYNANNINPDCSIQNGRRASDGGSNISLFSQFYSLKNINPQLNPNINTDHPSNDNENFEINNYINNLNLSQSRGSIKSGMPIFSSSSSSSPNSGNNISPLVASANSSNNSHSSEDEETSNGSSNNNNSNNPTNFFSNNNGIKYQRKSIKSRHEPYMDLSPNSASLNSNFLTTHCHQPSGIVFRTRPREKSFSGTNSTTFNMSSTNMSTNNSNSYIFGRSHRGSEPNPLELIMANKHNLERIYNQSINGGNNNQISLNKEFQILKQEITMDEDQQQQYSRWKQPKSPLQNFPKLDESEDHSNGIDLANQIKNSYSPIQNELSNSNMASSSVNMPNNNNSSTFSALALSKSSEIDSNEYLINHNLLCNDSMIDQDDSKNKDLINYSFSINNSNNNNNTNNNSFFNNNDSNIIENNSGSLNSANNIDSINSLSSSNLQIIQEEQNETGMFSSTSSSVSSSASTTPRLNRSILSIHEKLQQQHQLKLQQHQQNYGITNGSSFTNDANNNSTNDRSNTKNIFSILNGHLNQMPSSTNTNLE